jgi:hypothetical protein
LGTDRGDGAESSVCPAIANMEWTRPIGSVATSSIRFAESLDQDYNSDSSQVIPALECAEEARRRLSLAPVVGSSAKRFSVLKA